MAIPLVDLKAQYRSIKDEIDAAVRDVIESAAFIGGEQVSSFEAEFAGYCGVSHAIACGNGTDALEMALKVVGVGAGDEVIMPTMTFAATAEAVVACGARPVLVDSDPFTGLMDVSKVENAITAKSRALLPVHLYGNVVDMDPLMSIAARHGLPIVEDAAQAHGACYGEKRAGSLGTIAGFSFYPGKNLGAYGDAGAVTTNDDHLAAEVRLLRDHGRVGKYVHAKIGRNSRMDALQAAILRVKLRHLDRWNEARRQRAQWYDRELASAPVQRLGVKPNVEPVYHLYVVKVRCRDAVLKVLRERGISAGIHYPAPIHLQPAYEFLGYGVGSFPVAEEIAREALSLPMYPELAESQVCAISEALCSAIRGCQGTDAL